MLSPILAAGVLHVAAFCGEALSVMEPLNNFGQEKNLGEKLCPAGVRARPWIWLIFRTTVVSNGEFESA